MPGGDIGFVFYVGDNRENKKDHRAAHCCTVFKRCKEEVYVCVYFLCIVVDRKQNSVQFSRFFSVVMIFLGVFFKGFYRW